MRWYHYVAYFFGGAFLASALPHLGNGISGHPFQSPFASFDLRKTPHVLALAAGILLMSVMAAHAFGRFHGGS